MTNLKHLITKFCQCETLTFPAHLYNEYGTITSYDLTENFNCMTACWNTPKPIADLFQQLNDGNKFSEKGNEIINDSQLLRLLYDNVHASRIFNKTLKNWRKNQILIKYMQNFSHS